MLIAHIADTHLGTRQYNLEEREKDFYDAFDEAVEKIIASRVELVIHSGDLFDNARPSIRALVEAKKGIKKLIDSGIKVVMIAGNHDIVMRTDALPPQKLYDNVVLLTPKNFSFVFGDVFIGGLPYFPRSYKNVLLEKLKEIEKEAAGHEKRILALHQGIDKYLPFENELNIAELPIFDYYALGHIHDRIEDSFDRSDSSIDKKARKCLLCYPGSTEIWRTDEIKIHREKGKGFFVFDTENFRVKRVDLENIRGFVQAEVKESEGIEESIEKISKLFDSAKKKPVLDVKIDEENFQLAQEKIRRSFAEKALHISIKRSYNAKEEEERELPTSISIKEMIREAMKSSTEEERSFAADLFELLSTNETEEAEKLAKEFYRRWNR